MVLSMITQPSTACYEEAYQNGQRRFFFVRISDVGRVGGAAGPAQVEGLFFVDHDLEDLTVLAHVLVSSQYLLYWGLHLLPISSQEARSCRPGSSVLSYSSTARFVVSLWTAWVALASSILFTQLLLLLPTLSDILNF